MNEAEVQKKLQDILTLVTTDIGSIRSGRATPSLVEDLEVTVYGGASRLRIQEVASVSAPDPQQLVIDPYDKSIIGDIKKGIMAANLGMNPSIDGQIIRIAIPPMTTEDRERFVKLLNTKLENGKIMVRQERGEVMKDIKRMFEDKEIAEDDKFAQEKKLQEMVDKVIGEIETRGEAKRQDLMKM